MKFKKYIWNLIKEMEITKNDKIAFTLFAVGLLFTVYLVSINDLFFLFSLVPLTGIFAYIGSTMPKDNEHTK